MEKDEKLKKKKMKKKEKYPDLKKSDISLNNVTKKTKILSVLCVIFLVTGIGIFAYLISYLDNPDVFKSDGDEEKTYTVSRALAHGNKPGIISCVLISLFFLYYLISLRGPIRGLAMRKILIILSSALIISLLWVTVNLTTPGHYVIASFIFLFILIFEINVLYYFYINNKEDKSLFRSLIGIAIIFSALLLIFACINSNKVSRDVFATFEIIFSFLFTGVILLLGFYHN